MTFNIIHFHVWLGKKRTTVSLHEVLCGLLAAKLGEIPETPEAHTAVREWLQDTLDESKDPGRFRVSQWLQGEVALCIADTKISKRYLSALYD